ncbi:MAG: dienelactone hydrolase [Pseudonocardiales bacterium]|nr:MAG: dienelactone hydrolase [Pseudonocardiales bacterium]
MCHSNDSRPPASPSSGKVAEHGSLELTSADRTVFSAYEATPATPNGMGVVILPDVRGVHLYYQQLAQSFAEAGFRTVAIDYYGRTAGVGERDDDFAWGDHVEQVDVEQVALDVAAAKGHLSRAAVGPTFTVGFCFGGSQSWRLSGKPELGLAGVIGFYGQPKLVTDVVGDFAAPVLMLIAGDDVVTPQEEFDALEAQLQAAGASYEMHRYPGAPHSFFDRSFDGHADACADAWNRILSFTQTQGARVPATV